MQPIQAWIRKFSTDAHCLLQRRLSLISLRKFKSGILPWKPVEIQQDRSGWDAAYFCPCIPAISQGQQVKTPIKPDAAKTPKLRIQIPKFHKRKAVQEVRGRRASRPDVQKKRRRSSAYRGGWELPQARFGGIPQGLWISMLKLCKPMDAVPEVL